MKNENKKQNILAYIPLLSSIINSMQMESIIIFNVINKSMKKNLRNGNFFPRKLPRKSIIMKTLLLWLFLVSLNVSSVYSQQQKRMDISMKKATLVEVFGEIRRVCGYSFVYDSDAIKTVKPISIDLKNATVGEILDKCFAGTSFVYLMEDNVVIIKQQKVSEIRGQQTAKQVVGWVTDEKKMPLPGVTVIVKGLTLGSATDMNGKYTLFLPDIDKVSLLYSFIGMETVEMKYTGQDTINVVMKEEHSELSEVVVTGYQTIDRRKNTSAVQSIDMDRIKVPGVQTVDQLLESHVPGMIFMQNSGQVGAAPKLRIRGTSTILGNQEPVWVLDGIVLRDPVNVSPTLINNLDFVNLVGNAISGINPEDIERIDILKDASATALYGAKAANGVINITTKKGKTGPPSVTYSLNGKFTARPRYSDKSIYLMNSKERVAYSREIIEKGLSYPTINNWVGYEGALEKYNSGIYNYQQFTDEVSRLETVNTDWFDLITEDVFSNSHTLSLSGGSTNIRYYASLGYSNEKGVIKGEKNDRYSSSLNINGNFNKFSFSFGMLANKGVREYVNSEVNILDYAYNTSRAIPAFNEDGSYYFYNVEGTTAASHQRSLAFNALHEMENYRDEVIVIFAGYPEKMKEFLEQNEGLASRIAFHLNFPDYSPVELTQILDLMLEKSEYRMDERTREKCFSICADACREENYGNGRFVRNLLDHAIMRQADRLIREHQNGTLEKEEACLLTADDFEMIGLKKKPQSRQIGFCAGRTA